MAQWKRDHTTSGDGDQTVGDGAGKESDAESSGQVPPFPSRVEGFTSVVEAGWDTDVTRRPHGQRTTVVVHLDVEQRIAALHLGPLLSEADRRQLLCDAVPPCPGPTGERADWWWYDPFQPQPPPTAN